MQTHRLAAGPGVSHEAGHRRTPSLWADSGPDGRRALATALFAPTDVLGFEIELGLSAALPAQLELEALAAFVDACGSISQTAAKLRIRPWYGKAPSC